MVVAQAPGTVAAAYLGILYADSQTFQRLHQNLGTILSTSSTVYSKVKIQNNEHIFITWIPDPFDFTLFEPEPEAQASESKAG